VKLSRGNKGFRGLLEVQSIVVNLWEARKLIYESLVGYVQDGKLRGAHLQEQEAQEARTQRSKHPGEGPRW
jgi:hypothetical protein